MIKWEEEETLAARWQEALEGRTPRLTDPVPETVVVPDHVRTRVKEEEEEYELQSDVGADLAAHVEGELLDEVEDVDEEGGGSV